MDNRVKIISISNLYNKTKYNWINLSSNIEVKNLIDMFCSKCQLVIRCARKFWAHRYHHSYLWATSIFQHPPAIASPMNGKAIIGGPSTSSWPPPPPRWQWSCMRLFGVGVCQSIYIKIVCQTTTPHNLWLLLSLPGASS